MDDSQLHADGLLLRPFEDADAAAFAVAVRESAEGMRRWMPWSSVDYRVEQALQWTVDRLAARHLRREGEGWRLDRTDFPRELQRRLLLTMWALATGSARPPRGDSVDRAIAMAAMGKKASLGGWLLVGGSGWSLLPAPPRR